MVRRVSRRNYRSKRVKSGRSRSLRKRVRSKSVRKIRRRKSRKMRGGAQEKGGDCSPNLAISENRTMICRDGKWGEARAKARTGNPQPRSMSNEERTRLQARAAASKQARDAEYKERGDLDMMMAKSELDAETGVYDPMNI